MEPDNFHLTPRIFRTPSAAGVTVSCTKLVSCPPKEKLTSDKVNIELSDFLSPDFLNSSLSKFSMDVLSGSAPDFVSSDLPESSHTKETLDMEIGTCRGFLNIISTFIASPATQIFDSLYLFGRSFDCTSSQLVLAVANDGTMCSSNDCHTPSLTPATAGDA
uniref:Uncharacterized protein n=1 Tax=Rhizophora mucronata TaxID=61149 RepID=A0A2P2ML24_RHIMU